jgi:hypothetical protein
MQGAGYGVQGRKTASPAPRTRHPAPAERGEAIMPELTYRDAIAEVLRDEMRKDERVPPG